MKTAKEEASEFIEKFGKLASQVVDEIIDVLENYDKRTEENLKELNYFSSELQNMDGDFRYWDKVKFEINKQQNE